MVQKKDQHFSNCRAFGLFNTSKDKKIDNIKVLYTTDFNAIVKVATLGKHQELLKHASRNMWHTSQTNGKQDRNYCVKTKLLSKMPSNNKHL